MNAILWLLCLSRVDALQTINQDNFWSFYFSKLWEAIESKLTAVKRFFETEVPKLVAKVERGVQELHIKEEIEEKTEAIANATTKVKRYFADWDDKLHDTVDSFRFVFVLAAALFIVSLVAYLYLECSIVRKLLLAIPRFVFHVVKQLFKGTVGKKKKPNYADFKCHGDVCVHKV